MLISNFKHCECQEMCNAKLITKYYTSGLLEYTVACSKSVEYHKIADVVQLTSRKICISVSLTGL